MLNARRIARTTGRAISSITLMMKSGQNGWNRCPYALMPAPRIGNELNPEEHEERERRRGVQIGRGRAAEGQTHLFKGQQSELIEHPNEDEDRDEDRHEAFARASQGTDSQDRIGN